MIEVQLENLHCGKSFGTNKLPSTKIHHKEKAAGRKKKALIDYQLTATCRLSYRIERGGKKVHELEDIKSNQQRKMGGKLNRISQTCGTT